MINYYYFTDVDLLIGQSSNEAFGEIISGDPAFESSKDKYRLTSMHRATSDPLAYAVCKGKVLVQEDQSNSNLVNIVLMPLDQPNLGLPVIKYFIYRGVLKNSLTDGTNVINGGNTLAYDILDNNSNSPQKILGIELTGTNYTDSDLIEDAFYMPKNDFELWTVMGGWSIGSFDKDSFGFEIIFERLGYEINLGCIRKSQNIFEITKLSSTPSDADIFDFKTEKEYVTTFLDPCAFYGNFFNSKLKVRKSTDSTNSEFVHEFSKKSSDEIYRDVIDGGTVTSPQNIFYNRNMIYLDIRNDFNMSFNYFDNYSNSLRMSFVDDETEPSDTFDYYQSGWPILKLNNPTCDGTNVIIRIAFPTKDSMKPFVCVITGERKIGLVEKVKRGKSDFFSLDVSETDSYSSDSLYLKSPCYDENISVSQYIRLKYLDEMLTDENPVNEYTPVKAGTIDFIFQPTAFRQPINTNDTLKINLYDENRYINLLDDFNKDYTAKIGFAKDIGNTILFCSVSRRKTKSRFASETPSFSLTKSSDKAQYFAEFINNKSVPGLNGKELLIDSASVQFLNEPTIAPSFFKRRNSIDFDLDFFSMVLSNEDFETILSVADTNFTSIYSPYLCLSNKTESSSEDVDFLKYDIVLKGLKRNSSDVMEIAEFSSGVSIYTYTNDSLK